jgi:hypothetical protein
MEIIFFFGWESTPISFLHPIFLILVEIKDKDSSKFLASRLVAHGEINIYYFKKEDEVEEIKNDQLGSHCFNII